MVRRLPVPRIVSHHGCCLVLLVYGLVNAATPQQPVFPGNGPLLAPDRLTSPGIGPIHPQSDPPGFASRHLLTLTFSESLANCFVAREVSDSGPVRDRILGAEVTGAQSTHTKVTLDYVGCPINARMFLHLRGNTTNQTSAWTPQATVRSEGCYQFQLSKQIDLNGLRIATRSPAAFIETRQRNIAANSPNDGIPVVGPLVSMVAFYTAEQQRPLAERIAAHRVTQQIGPRFNGEVDAQLATLNEQLVLLQSMLSKAFSAGTVTIASQSTDELMQVGFGSAPASAAPAPTTGSAGLQLTLHEQLVEQVLAQLPLAGFSANDTEIDRVLRGLRQNPLGLLTAAAPDDILPPMFARVTLVGPKPIEARFEDAAVLVTVVLGFQPVLGSEIPPHRIVMKFTPRIENDGVRVAGELVDVTSADPTAAVPLGEATTTILRQQIAQRLETFVIPDFVPLPALERGPQALKLTGLEIRQGWMVLAYEPQNAAPQGPTLPEQALPVLPTPSDAPTFPAQNR
jgi:hypothetical protein